MLVKGVAHVTFSVNEFDEVLPFYQKLFSFLELKPMIQTKDYFYCVGARVGLGIQRCAAEFEGVGFNQLRAGLHHYCLALPDRESVDELAQFVLDQGAELLRAPAAQDQWVPGMYSVLFSDPGGIRIEANHISC